MYFIIGWLAYLDSGAFGADQGEEAALIMGFWMVMTKSLKTLRMARLRRLVLLLARPE